MTRFSMTGRCRFSFALLGLMLALSACVPQAAVPTIIVPTVATRPTVGAPTTAPQSTVTPALAEEFDALFTVLEEKRAFNGAVLIAHDGELLFSQGYGYADYEQKIPNTPTTRFRLGSVTKQFTAAAILVLRAQGKLNLNDPICDYLDPCPDSWQPITIHQILTHTSGIPEFAALAAYKRNGAALSSPAETVALFRDEPLDFAPGSSWKYSNSGYILLGLIIERASGQSYEKFLQQSIFEPLQLENSGYDDNQQGVALGYDNRWYVETGLFNPAVPYATGGLFSTVEDLYRWDQALYTDRILSQALRDQMFTAHAPLPNADGSGYGYGWMIGQHLGHTIYSHDGQIDGFRTYFARFPDDRLTIIVLCNRDDIDAGYTGLMLAKKVFERQ